MIIGGVATLVLLLVVAWLLWRTGGAKVVSDNAAVIGALVALGGVFTAQMVSIALDDRRTQEARALEDRRTQEARDLEARRAGEAALQNYFEAVGDLLIEKPLRRASPGDNLSTVVRAQTLSVLEGLDPARKRILLLFLYESGLIYQRKLVVRLAAANLAGAHLREANLHRTNLSGVHLGNADLREANLSGATLRGADLRGAQGWTEEQLREALDHLGTIMPDGRILQGAIMPVGRISEDAGAPDRPTFEEWLKGKGSEEDG